MLLPTVEASSNTHLWSDSYDRTIDDVFYIQHEVSTAIVAALKNELGLQIASSPRPVAQTTPEARDAYLRGRHLVVQRSAVTIENAVREFRTAVSFDPEFAPAHAELAIATLLISRGNYGDLPESETIRIAEPVAPRALALDPEIPEAHLGSSLVELMKGRYEESLPHLQHAIELSPSNALGYSWLGSAYDRLGRYEEYFETTKLALSLDPLSQPTLVNHIQNLTLRLDSFWVAGVGVEWQWTPTRVISATVNYIQLGDAPVTSPSIPVIGSATGRYSDRVTIYLELGMSLGTGSASR